MQIIKLDQTPSQQVLETTLAVLQAGGLVIFPTETVYGAGVDALNPQAVEKLLAYKSRREGKPLSVAVTDQQMAEKYVELNDSAKTIYQRFLPGPVTVVSKGLHQVAPGVESEYGTLGIRIPDYPLVLNLVRALGRPLTSTSANGSGKKRPYSIDDIMSQLSEKQKSLIDLVLDAGTLPERPPSTVIDTTLSTPVVFRQGTVTFGEMKGDGERLHLTSHSEQETKDIAKRILLKNWETVKENGLIIGLNGSLGMGKTVFVKGLAEFLNITETITSPTYTYIEEYPYERHEVAGKLFHLDVWKLEKPEEMERLGFSDLIGPRNVIVIEWASNVTEYLQHIAETQQLPYIEVNFTQTGSDRQLDIIL